MNATRERPDPALAEEVAHFLRVHPHFLAENPDLYRVLVPPRRVHGERVADHMAAMIAAERAAGQRNDRLLAGRRAAAGLAARVDAAVLALIRAHDPFEWVRDECAGLLGLDSAHLCAEGTRPGARPLPRGTVSRLLGRHDVVLRDDPAHAALLHAEAESLAERDALIRVPLRDGPALLALATRDPALLDPGPCPNALAHLGQALAAAVERSH